MPSKPKRGSADHLPAHLFVQPQKSKPAEEEDEDVSGHLDQGVPGALGRPDVHGPPQQPEPAQTGFALAWGPWSYSIGLSQFDIS